MGRPELQKITIAHKDRFLELSTLYGHGDSAHAFASLLIWSRAMDLGAAFDREAWIVRSGWKGKEKWFFPCGTEGGKKRLIEELLKEDELSLCYLTSEDLEFLEREFPGVFEIRESEDDSEYIYDRQEMIRLEGKSFSKIRNRLRAVEKAHRIEAAPLTTENLREVEEICGAWKRGAHTDEGIRDDTALQILLEHFKELEMTGVLLILDGTPWAAAAGFMLDAETFDCCLLKARENLPGVTDSLRRHLALSLPDGVTRLNFEEDMGVPGLRIMKQRLRPCCMKTMYTADKRTHE